MLTGHRSKSPHSRSHRPLCGWCYLFTVSNSDLLKPLRYRIWFYQFQSFTFNWKRNILPLMILNFGLWPWPMNFTYIWWTDCSTWNMKSPENIFDVAVQ